MTVIVHQVRAKCPPEQLWSVLSELTAVQHYNPIVIAARLVSGQAVGVGATRECDLTPKGVVTERVTTWEEGRAVGIEVVRSDWPITFMNWVTRVEPDAFGSRIFQRLEYGMKFGPLGWLLNRLVLRRAIERNVARALNGMVSHAEGRV